VDDRRTIASGSQWEAAGGYSRAVVVGRHVFVAGTAPVMPDGADPPPNAYSQTKRCLEIIAAALEEAGGGLEHVVRTRLFLANRDDGLEVVRAHGEVFGEIRPVSTGVVVGMLDPRWLVEVEADAILPE
jgi:enamine deaminase RidA (YjgF/YER057c/UK114 family)